MTSGEELLELRKSTGMNRREFAEYFEIPYRTGNLEIEECHTIFFVLWFTKWTKKILQSRIDSGNYFLNR